MKKIRITDNVFEPQEGIERSVLLTNAELGAIAKIQLMRLISGQIIKSYHFNARTECFNIVSGQGEIKENREVAVPSKNEIYLCQPSDVPEHTNISLTMPFPFRVLEQMISVTRA